MKSFRFFTLVSCGLAVGVGGQGLGCQSAWGQAGVALQVDELVPAAKKNVPVFEPPVLKRKQLQPPTQPLGQPAAANPRERVKQQSVAKPEGPPRQANHGQAKNASAPSNRPPLPSFWSRRQAQLPLENLSRASVYQLGSMGRYVHLTPAMRWHLERSGTAVDPTPSTERSSATTVPGQGAGAYYPGVSRIPAQKPFTNLERPATGLQRYWPLLLEGREDPNTGLIYWSLP